MITFNYYDYKRKSFSTEDIMDKERTLRHMMKPNTWKEIEEVRNGTYERDNNVLKNAPHTLASVTSSSWVYTYTREKAAFPLSFVAQNKFWPSVSRIDNAHGDRNLFCSCIPVEEYSE